MDVKIIDLSVPLENDVKADPPGRGPSIKYFGHKDLIHVLQGHFPGVAPQDLPDGEEPGPLMSCAQERTCRASRWPMPRAMMAASTAAATSASIASARSFTIHSCAGRQSVADSRYTLTHLSIGEHASGRIAQPICRPL